MLIKRECCVRKVFLNLFLLCFYGDFSIEQEKNQLYANVSQLLDERLNKMVSTLEQINFKIESLEKKFKHSDSKK